MTPPPSRQVTPLTKGRVRFMPLQMKNIHTHFRWNNDEELNRLDSEVPHREETFGTFKQRFEEFCDESSSSHRHFEIHDIEEEALIGVAYVTRINEHHRHALVGVTIGEKEYWGQGYGKDSLRLLLRYCFQEVGLHRVATEIFEYNAAWRELVEDLGFEKEGTARESLFRDGQYWDKDLYSLLDREYDQMYEADRASAESPA